MYIDDSPGIESMILLQKKSRKLKSEHGLKISVIDYLQLITTASKNKKIDNNYLRFQER